MTDPTIELINRLKEGTDMTESTPIVVNPSSVQAMIITGLRYFATVVGGVTAVLGLVGKRDLSGLIAYVQSADGLALIGAIVAIGGSAYGVFKTYSNKQKLVTTADAAPNSVAVVMTPAEAKAEGLK